MSKVSLTATAVAFLATDPSAQRLAISWPLVAKAAESCPEKDRNVAWAELASVPMTVAQKLGSALLQHGLCREDGTLADETAAVLNALAARKLKELRK